MCDDLTLHYDETGSLDPKPHWGDRPSKFQAEDIEIIKELIKDSYLFLPGGTEWAAKQIRYNRFFSLIKK